MPTQIVTVVQPNATTLANWTSNVKPLTDFLSGTAGWIQTADGGQVNYGTIPAVPGQVSGTTVAWNFRGAWSNVTAYNVGDIVTVGGGSYYCILANTNVSPPNATDWTPIAYMIFHSNDALFPIYVKLEFGVTTGSPTKPEIYATFGTGSDGNGNITGSVSNRISHVVTTNAGSATTASEHDLAGDVYWFAFALWRPASGIQNAFLSVDRSRDNNGNPDNRYFVIYSISDSAVVFYQICQNPALGSSLPSEASFPSNITSAASCALGGTIGIGAATPWYGKQDNPSLVCAVAKVNDMTEGASTPVVINGVTHNMMAGKALRFTNFPLGGGSSSTAQQGLLWRWE